MEAFYENGMESISRALDQDERQIGIFSTEICGFPRARTQPTRLRGDRSPQQLSTTSTEDGLERRSPP
jgi:hypothetical protein